MNAHDKGNLNFVVGLNDDEFDSWAEHASNDDLLYALELISTAKAELEVQRLELLDEINDCTEANKVLDMFRK